MVQLLEKRNLSYCCRWYSLILCFHFDLLQRNIFILAFDFGFEHRSWSKQERQISVSTPTELRA